MRQEPAVGPQEERVDDAHEPASHRERSVLVEVAAEHQEDRCEEMEVLTRHRPEGAVELTDLRRAKMHLGATALRIAIVPVPGPPPFEHGDGVGGHVLDDHERCAGAQHPRRLCEDRRAVAVLEAAEHEDGITARVGHGKMGHRRSDEVTGRTAVGLDRPEIDVDSHRTKPASGKGARDVTAPAAEVEDDAVRRGVTFEVTEAQLQIGAQKYGFHP